MTRRRRSSAATAAYSTLAAEAQFERELEVFRTEAATVAQFFYALLVIHAAAGATDQVYRLLNTAPLFWNTILGALQTAGFVALGRVFDQSSTHNVDRLLRLTIDHPQIFSKASLARRKQGDRATPPAWLADYMKDVYVPRLGDLRRLHGYVSKHRKIYNEKYRPLRHQVFAHKEISDATAVSAMFAKTNVRELQRMSMFLLSIYSALWQLFVNGRRPALRTHRYSVRRMRDRAAKNAEDGAVHERLVYEAERFLNAASKTG
jgi:hypothetical protein